ncbi:hypothetical protein BCR44DRAFT_1441579 [Catenaria anguillulae PL171]|uniref:Major facilitator superfamily domain-containing protein n=1 Tax=Catenaria anguillulae PL171 TaxID=765915 RepID=A0A1Y2HAX6_9FUNG|nr:hypothetical protein BCR44DRAFT_1441579 [Catenaria anguillulae PL171]
MGVSDSGLFAEFTPTERRNLAIYTLGMMAYKFALENLSGCFSNIVLQRVAINPSSTWSTIVSINFAAQSVGSLLVSPLIKRWPTARVLSTTIIVFALLVAVVPIMELLTGGGRDGTLMAGEKGYKFGRWNVMIVAGLFPAIGVAHGVIELVRRVIPSKIVGDDALKLRKMDSTVHIFYQVGGVSGALMSRYFIEWFSYAYTLTIIPVFFLFIVAPIWNRLQANDDIPAAKARDPSKAPRGMLGELGSIFKAFFRSVWIGCKLTLTNRSLVWLTMAYAFPFVIHRYKENVLYAHYANFALGRGAFQQQLVGGSNLGELLGACFVLFFANAVPTPLPWLRADAITLFILWVYPTVSPPRNNIEGFVWILTAINVPISFGWAAGDCSLVAYIQSRLAAIEDTDPSISPLGAVMSFLYILYITLFALLSQAIGRLQDAYVADLRARFGAPRQWPPLAGLARTQEAMFWSAGMVVTISGTLVLLSTLIPKGALQWNPDTLGDDSELDELRQQVKGNASVVEPGEKSNNDAIKNAMFA